MRPILMSVFMNLTREWVHHGPIIQLFGSGIGEGTFRDFKRTTYDVFRSDNLPFTVPWNVLKCLGLHILDQGFGSLRTCAPRFERLNQICDQRGEARRKGGYDQSAGLPGVDFLSFARDDLKSAGPEVSRLAGGCLSSKGL